MTNQYLQKIKEWLLLNSVNFISNLIVFIMILIAGHLLIQAVCRLLAKALERSLTANEILRGFIVNVAHKALWALVIMTGLQELGINMGPLIAGLGVTGFIIGFACQQTLGNLAAGMMLALNQPFKVGESIETAGVMGKVKELNMMATTLTTGDNKLVVIPNNKVWGSSIINYTAMGTRRVDIRIGISYSSEIDQARAVAKEVLAGIPEILADPVPVIEVIEMANSSVDMVIRPWVKSSDYWPTMFKINQRVKEAFARAGVVIPFPQLDVHHHGQLETKNLPLSST